MHTKLYEKKKVKYMKKYFFSSDYHFNHKNILKYENRPFYDVETMNNEIIKRHNERVKDGDIVFFLGDLGFYASKNAEIRGEGMPITAMSLLEQMNGDFIRVCLSSDTQTYVKNKGFLNYDEIKIGDEVLSVERKKHEKLFLKYTKILDKQVYPFDGKTYITTHRSAQMNVTPDHSLYLYPFNKESSSLTYCKAKDLFYKNVSGFNIPVSGWLNNEKKYNISENKIKLLAWIVAEGTINKNNQLQIYQNKGKKLNIICNLLDSENIKYSIYKGKGNKNKVIYVHREYVDDLLKYLPNKKHDIQFIINNFSTKQLLTFLREYVLGDGHYQKYHSFCIYTSNKKLAEQLAFLGTITGYKAYLTSRIRTLNNKKFIAYSISYCKKYYRRIINKEFKESHYKGIVYDFTTEGGNFLVKRNNTIFFTGNCGNHDTFSNKTHTPTHSITLKMGGLNIQLVHRPEDADLSHDLILHGHTHEKYPTQEKIGTNGVPVYLINCCVEQNDYRPFEFDEIKAKWDIWVKNHPNRNKILTHILRNKNAK